MEHSTFLSAFVLLILDMEHLDKPNGCSVTLDQSTDIANILILLRSLYRSVFYQNKQLVGRIIRSIRSKDLKDSGMRRFAERKVKCNFAKSTNNFFANRSQGLPGRDYCFSSINQDKYFLV